MEYLQNYWNNCRLQLFTEFIQSQKWYPSSFPKITILT